MSDLRSIIQSAGSDASVIRKATLHFDFGGRLRAGYSYPERSKRSGEIVPNKSQEGVMP